MPPEPDPPDLALILMQLGDLARPIAIRTAIALDLFDRLGETAKTPDELAAEADATPAAMERLLAALHGFGLLSRQSDGQYGLAETAACLCATHPLDMSGAFRLAPTELRAWAELEHCARTGEAGFEKAYGYPHRQYRSEHPEEDARMDHIHHVATRLDLLTLARVFPWGEAETIVDVGGGSGMFLAGILSKFLRPRGTLLDLPRMIGDAPAVLAAYGVADRCELVAGSFFDRVPSGADLYVLKAVLGGWDDEACVRILGAVRDAMPVHGRLLVIEPAASDDGFARGHLVQLHTLVLYGGSYRGLEDYQRLAAAAGLSCQRIFPRPTLSIIELTRSS